MSERKKILVCPLDWGLGHATRCVPIINELLAQGAEVVIAADGRPLELLRQEFPELDSITFHGYGIEYPSGDGMILKMALSIPKILNRINREGKELQAIVEQHKIDAVISDNRYGLWKVNVPNVLIIHQLMVKSPFGESLLNKITRSYVSKYTQCWVPDFAGENNLSGDLSHKFEFPDNVKFVGALSRFEPPAGKVEKKYDLLALISGPEPQRTVFEEEVLEQLKSMEGKFAVVAGRPGEETPENLPVGIEYYPHLGADELRQKLLEANVVLSRPGYSTIMDLAALGSKAIFVPTPGQTEQEYLAHLYTNKGLHYSIPQKQLNIEYALKQTDRFSGFTSGSDRELLKKAVGEFLSLIPSPQLAGEMVSE